METAPRLKLPLSKVTSENFLSALRILGSEKLHMKLSYKIGRCIKQINGYLEDWHRARLDGIKRHGAEEVAGVRCQTPDCGSDLTGPKEYDALCTKCGKVTMVPKSAATFWRIPPNQPNALLAFQEEMKEALDEEVEIFLNQKISLSDLDGIKLPPLAAMELVDIIEEPT